MPVVSTGSKYGYGVPVWERPINQPHSEKLTMLFEVDAASDAHLWLSDGGSSGRRGYEIVIGGWKNKRSEIRRGQQGTQLACQFHLDNAPLRAGSMTKFWLAVLHKPDSVTIVVGTGRDTWKNKVMMAVDSTPRRVKGIDSIAVSTGFGSEGKWDVLVMTDLPIESMSEEKENEHTQVRIENKTPEKSILIRNTIVVTGSGASGLLKRPRGAFDAPAFVSVQEEAARDEKRRLSMDLHRAIAKGRR
jgi:hypothetical protein